MSIPKSLTRAAMSGHGLLGVLFGAVVFLLCLTGSVLVMVDQLGIWERPDAVMIGTVSSEAIAPIADASLRAARAAGFDHDVFLRFPTDEFPRMTVIGIGEKGGHREWDVATGSRLVPHVETPWIEFLQQLHFNLTMPGALGRYIVGLFGTLLLASLATGILAHRRILKDAFRLRLGGSARLSNADLHNRIGVWALPFHMIVALTGSLLGLAGLITALLALAAYKGDQDAALASLLGPQAKDSAIAAPPPDIRAIVRSIEQAAPGARITQMSFEHPGKQGQQVRAFIAAPGHLARNEGLLFDAAGRLKWTAGFTDGNVGTRIYGMITPLHYGTYGGVALKLIYLILGASLTLIVATGGNIWIARRREQGRPAPRLELLWLATIWGQPLVLTLLAIISAGSSLPLLPIYWALTALLWTAGMLMSDAKALGRCLRLCLGGGLLVLAVAHVTQWGFSDPVSLIVDAVLASGGVALFWRETRGTLRGMWPAASRRPVGPQIGDGIGPQP